MKSILILGGSMLQLPAIKKALELGMWVVVADQDPNCVGRPFADAFYETSTMDKEALLKVAKTECVDGVLVLATDGPNRCAGYINDQLKLKGISEKSAFLVTDKYAMAKTGTAAGIPFPKFLLVEDEMQAIATWDHYPAICKPLASSGSRGVTYVENVAELSAAFIHAKEQSHANDVLLESFVGGTEYSLEAFILKGQVKIVAITEKLTTGIPHFVELGHYQPCNLNETVFKQLTALLKKIPEAYQLNNIGLHVEFKVSENRVTVIEFGARLGGEMITTHLVPSSTGIDFIKIALKLAVNDSIPKTLYQRKHTQPTAMRFIESPASGNLRKIDFPDELGQQLNKKVFLFKRPGDWLTTNLQESGQRVGLIIQTGLTKQAAVNNCERAVASFTLDVEENVEKR
jgi:biotin carboxylase